MDKQSFEIALTENADLIEQIREMAHKIHEAVNQHYDHVHPYGFHLDMVADQVKARGAEACAGADDVPAIMFGAYFHDSIEDARLTYNDVLEVARRFLPEDKARMATEIAYALTNEKGRTRAERANEAYYRGIRTTPYAPMVKMADRLANMTYSAEQSNRANGCMYKVYKAEAAHFLNHITVGADVTDGRLKLPIEMINVLTNL